jgi:hypothetical protein
MSPDIGEHAFCVRAAVGGDQDVHGVPPVLSKGQIVKKNAQHWDAASSIHDDIDTLHGLSASAQSGQGSGL